ncbi:MAG TPA: DNA methyltransferase [Acidobacteriaceae bacterium]|nr:DNA methyltransferase [Acidobacteriaceae bacterium]
MVEATEGVFENLARAAQDTRRVQGATHKFYRYPARFSPLFVQAAIEQFTKPGDLVFDPFVGGGTTLVEAMRLGRASVGSDINELAIFISQVKTTLLAESAEQQLRRWAEDVGEYVNMHAPADADGRWRESGYFKHMEANGVWRYRKAIQQVLNATAWLPDNATREFARCALLRTAQAALDGKRSPPPISTFRTRLVGNLSEMLDDMAALRRETAGIAQQPCRVLKQAADQAHTSSVFDQQKPRLVLTSPPYPGVHVLYHRWQIGGRRETAAPYWIANRLDGDGERYYTLGHRKEKGLATYYRNLEASFHSIAQVCSPETVIVQVVAFSDPEWQLDRYLGALANAGLQEISPGEQDRLWRDVPNRRWHALSQARHSSAREVVLFHRLG